jgi:hypothetical protein
VCYNKSLPPYYSTVLGENPLSGGDGHDESKVFRVEHACQGIHARKEDDVVKHQTETQDKGGDAKEAKEDRCVFEPCCQRAISRLFGRTAQKWSGV